MPPRKDSAASEMRYACDQTGCSKSYSRPDHLLRHKLNHVQDRVLSCDQCDRTFVRQDLLLRHLERHALRGKTLGRWSNRSKDEHNPNSDNETSPQSSTNLHHKPSIMRESQVELGNLESEISRQDQYMESVQGKQAPVKLPAIEPFAVSASNDQAAASGWSGLDRNSSPSSRTFNTYQTSVTWPHNPTSSNLQSASSHVSAVNSFRQPVPLTDGIISPNPGSGFNFPTSTATQNFTFHGPARRDENSWPRPDPLDQLRQRRGGEDSPETLFRWVPPEELVHDVGRGSYAPPPSSAYLPNWHDTASAHDRINVNRPTVDPPGNGAAARVSATAIMSNQDLFPFAPPNTDHTADYSWLFDGVDPFVASQRHMQNAAASHTALSQASGFSPSSSDGIGGFLGNVNGSHLHTGNWHARGQGDASNRGMSSDGVFVSGSEADSPNALEDLAFFASLQAEIPNRPAFSVDAVAHHRLLVFLQSVSELPNSSLFTPSALRCYTFLFFTKFNRLYPLIHEPTFVASTTDSMLLSAVIVIGAHFAGFPAHELAVRIAQKIWGAIVSLDDFRPARATLPMLQAMVLTEAFGKMMSTRPQHEMAHLFHNFIVTLARRNAVFNATATSQPRQQEVDEAWRNWAREEEKKRTALFEFMLDAQHATLFRHIPSLSSFQIQLDLPCSDEEWSQTTPEAWKRHRKDAGYKSPAPFIPALKACLSPSTVPQGLDAFPRLVLIHGLMSIAYDLQWKQDVLLGAETHPGGSKGDNLIGDWKNRLSAAYSSLQARMNIAYTVADENSSPKYIHRATPSLITAAQLALFVDMIDVQIYAGLPSVLGRFIDRNTFNTSRRSVRDWAKSPDGRTAVWYAVHFLRASLLNSELGGSKDAANRMKESSSLATNTAVHKTATEHKIGVDDVLHHQWCQYRCALVIWAYGHALMAPRYGAADLASNTRPSSAHRTSMPQLSELSAPVSDNVPEDATAPSSSFRSVEKMPGGADFLLQMSTKTADEISLVDCKCNTKGVLQMVEKELRGSRWELGREASGVLRKLISNQSQTISDRSHSGKSAQLESDNHTSRDQTDSDSAETLRLDNLFKKTKNNERVPSFQNHRTTVSAQGDTVE